VPGVARAVERPFASHAQQLGNIDSGDGRPADPVIAQQVHDRQPFVVCDDARALNGRVDHAGDKQQDERGHDGQVIPALHGQVDQVADREQHPYPPDHDSERRPERLSLGGRLTGCAGRRAGGGVPVLACGQRAPLR